LHFSFPSKILFSLSKKHKVPRSTTSNVTTVFIDFAELVDGKISLNFDNIILVHTLETLCRDDELN